MHQAYTVKTLVYIPQQGTNILRQILCTKLLDYIVGEEILDLRLCGFELIIKHKNIKQKTSGSHLSARSGRQEHCKENPMNSQHN